MINKGTLIISLDFEMMWGALDLWTPEDYGQTNVQHVEEVIQRLITLFKKYEIHATFASVGLLMLRGKEEEKKYRPSMPPSYLNAKLSPYNDNYIDNIGQESLYFAPYIIHFLKEQKNVEVASHTFSHYYCWEKGQTAEQFEEDMRLTSKVAKEKGVQLDSIVFPRNQVSNAYLEICAKYGFKVYRGISPRFSSLPKNNIHAFLQRIGRLIDTYNIWGTPSTIKHQSINTEPIINVPSSRFLRPYDRRLKLLDRLRLKRIQREMSYAAKHGEMYHLWWHPHNFGANMNENFDFLEKILETYKTLQMQYGMESMTMKEYAHYFK